MCEVGCSNPPYPPPTEWLKNQYHLCSPFISSLLPSIRTYIYWDACRIHRILELHWLNPLTNERTNLDCCCNTLMPNSCLRDFVLNENQNPIKWWTKVTFHARNIDKIANLSDGLNWFESIFVWSGCFPRIPFHIWLAVEKDTLVNWHRISIRDC